MENLTNLKKNSTIYSQGQQQLIQLEDAAKAAGKGKWNTAEAAKHIRNVKWTVENARNFVDSHHNKPIDGKNSFLYLTPNLAPLNMSHIIMILSLSSEILAMSTVIKKCFPNIQVMRSIECRGSLFTIYKELCEGL